MRHFPFGTCAAALKDTQQLRLRRCCFFLLGGCLGAVPWLCHYVPFRYALFVSISFGNPYKQRFVQLYSHKHSRVAYVRFVRISSLSYIILYFLLNQFFHSTNNNNYNNLTQLFTTTNKQQQQLVSTNLNFYNF